MEANRRLSITSISAGVHGDASSSRHSSLCVTRVVFTLLYGVATMQQPVPGLTSSHVGLRARLDHALAPWRLPTQAGHRQSAARLVNQRVPLDGDRRPQCLGVGPHRLDARRVSLAWRDFFSWAPHALEGSAPGPQRPRHNRAAAGGLSWRETTRRSAPLGVPLEAVARIAAYLQGQSLRRRPRWPPAPTRQRDAALPLRPEAQHPSDTTDAVLLRARPPQRPCTACARRGGGGCAPTTCPAAGG
jgi:hypothetical protein